MPRLTDKTPRLCTRKKCDRRYIPTHDAQKYCSVPCADASKRMNKPKKIYKPTRSKPCAREGCPGIVRYWPSTEHIKKFCSRACTYKSRIVIHTRFCEYCGGPFFARYKIDATKRFCSSNCKHTYIGNRNRKLPLTKRCINCGVEFKPTHHRSPHCSRKCANWSPERRAKISATSTMMWQDPNCKARSGVRRAGIRRAVASKIIKELGVGNRLIEATEQTIKIPRTDNQTSRRYNFRKGNVAVAILKELGYEAELENAVNQAMKGERNA